MIKDEYLKIYEETNNIISCMDLFKSAVGDNQEYKVIKDFDLACTYAFEYNEFYYKDEDEYMWSDIKSNVFSEISKYIYRLYNYKEIDEFVGQLKLTGINTISIDKEAKKVFDEIYSDLTLCMRSRIITRGESQFFEDILNIYSLGGWPCGWEGNYPLGKFIVYFPN